MTYILGERRGAPPAAEAIIISCYWAMMSYAITYTNHNII